MADSYSYRALRANLCKRCAQFYGNQDTDRMCSVCYKISQPMSAFAGLHAYLKATSPEKSSNKIRNGLLFYTFEGQDDWRLRSKHSKSFIANDPRYLRKEAARSSYQKTLKYVRRFKDIRTGTNDTDLKDDKYYYLSYRVIRHLKGVTSLNVMIINGVSSSIFKKLCQILSKLNPNNLTFNFFSFYSEKYVHEPDYIDSFFRLIRRMKNLRYLDTGGIACFRFKPKFETRLLIYARMISRLSYLTDIKLGDFYSNYLSALFKVFLDHGYPKRIQLPIIHLFSTDEVGTLFEKLGSIKELGYLEIRTSSMCATNDADKNLLEPIWHFLSSIKSVETFVLNHTQAIYTDQSDNDTIPPKQITNIRSLVIKGYIADSSIKIMQAVKGLDSLEIHMDKIQCYDKAVKTLNKLLLENQNLRNLTIKLGKLESLFLLPLFNDVILLNSKTITLDFLEAQCANHFIVSDYKIGLSIIQFLRNQPQIENIVLKLPFPIDLEKLKTFLGKLTELPKLNSITLYLERLKEVLLSKENYLNELDAFCNAFENSKCLEFDLKMTRYAILKPIKP